LLKRLTNVITEKKKEKMRKTVVITRHQPDSSNISTALFTVSYMTSEGQDNVKIII
jgi:hypothetical protein